MERGLVWLPLLGLFIWLAWTGWQEYQKVEGYRVWSKKFDQSKYDIYAVLGKKDVILTWGKPTPKGILNLASFSLKDVENITLVLGDRVIDQSSFPLQKNKDIPSLVFKLKNQENPIKIPFTQLELASQWETYLKKEN